MQTTFQSNYLFKSQLFEEEELITYLFIYAATFHI